MLVQIRGNEQPLALNVHFRVVELFWKVSDCDVVLELRRQGRVELGLYVLRQQLLLEHHDRHLEVEVLREVHKGAHVLD